MIILYDGIDLLTILLAFSIGAFVMYNIMKSRRYYIHMIKEMEYLYKRLGIEYEKPPVGFGSTPEVKRYEVK